MGIDSDRFERPKPCSWCGEVFEHRADCPKYSGISSTEVVKNVVQSLDGMADLFDAMSKRIVELEARIAALEAERRP